MHAADCALIARPPTNLGAPCFLSPPVPVALLRPKGVEHLLRNVKDATLSTLASDVGAKLQALKGLRSRLGDVQVRRGGRCS